MKSASLPAPKIEDFCGGVKITLYRPTTYMDALKLTGKPDGTPLRTDIETKTKTVRIPLDCRNDYLVFFIGFYLGFYIGFYLGFAFCEDNTVA
jgi:hypothetical protein